VVPVSPFYTPERIVFPCHNEGKKMAAEVFLLPRLQEAKRKNPVPGAL
jgi:hypothetical protein